MPSARSFDYGKELALNTKDAGLLEEDVNDFLDQRRLFDRPHAKGDNDAENELKPLVIAFLETGPHREGGDVSKPGKNYWIHPPLGLSASQLSWPENIDL